MFSYISLQNMGVCHRRQGFGDSTLHTDAPGLLNPLFDKISEYFSSLPIGVRIVISSVALTLLILQIALLIVNLMYMLNPKSHKFLGVRNTCIKKDLSSFVELEKVKATKWNIISPKVRSVMTMCNLLTPISRGRACSNEQTKHYMLLDYTGSAQSEVNASEEEIDKYVLAYNTYFDLDAKLEPLDTAQEEAKKEALNYCVHGFSVIERRLSSETVLLSIAAYRAYLRLDSDKKAKLDFMQLKFGLGFGLICLIIFIDIILLCNVPNLFISSVLAAIN